MNNRLNMHLLSLRFFIMAVVACTSAYCLLFFNPAQADTAPVIIVAPESSPTPPFNVHGPADAIFPAISATLHSNLEQLNTNLGILVDLNTPQNQAILDKFAKDYGASSTLGTDFKTALAGLDTAKLKHDSDIFSTNSAAVLKDYQKTLIALTERVKNGEVRDGTLPETIVRPLFKNLNGQMAALGKMDVAINILNINVISINKTYLNLLSLSKQSPSVLINLPNLSLKLNSLDTLANEELTKLTHIDTALAAANTGYGTFRKDGGLQALTDPASNSRDTLGTINSSLRNYTEELHLSLMNMSDTLGRLPVRAAEPDAPAATNKIDISPSVFHSTQ